MAKQLRICTAEMPHVSLNYLNYGIRFSKRRATNVTKHQPTAPSEETCTKIYFKRISKVMKVNVTSQVSDANARALVAQLQFFHFLSL